jgi:putative cell wall-binding protein
VFALLLALIAPALAGAGTASSAGTPRPVMIKPDPYEPDDTTATAKVLPEYSVHTIDNSSSPMGGHFVPDVDMFKLTAEDTGTPWCIEARQLAGYFACIMTASEVTSSGALAQLDTSIGLWGLTIGNTMIFRAPHPGTFYVSLEPVLFGNGVYELKVTKGLAERVAGDNRYDTAAEVSHLMWPNAANPIAELIAQIEDTSTLGPAGCVLARGDDFADALAGSAFAGMVPHLGMPVLLTGRDQLPSVTMREILRLSQMRLWTHQPFTVYILGSETAVGRGVEDELRMFEADDLVGLVHVVRLGGRNRFETATRIAALEASTPIGTGNTAFLVNGFAFPDALAAAPVASRARGPVLMTRRLALPFETKAFLLAHPEMHNVVVAGSASVVASSVLEELAAAPLSRNVIRLHGADRYKTALKLAEFGVDKLGMNSEGMQVVSGATFADGLSAGPMSAFTGAPLLLTRPSSLSTEVIGFYEEYGPGPGRRELPLYVVGGPAAVSDLAFDQLNDYWR